MSQSMDGGGLRWASCKGGAAGASVVTEARVNEKGGAAAAGASASTGGDTCGETREKGRVTEPVVFARLKSLR